MTGHKVLVVDGDLASRNYIAAALKQEDHSVIQAASGKEGLIAAWRDLPDLIIVDPVLPDLTAEEFARRVRSDQRTASVPLIALSSDPQPGRRKSCMDAGFNEYLVKSAEAVPVLLQSINKILDGASIGPKAGGLLIVFLSAKGGTGTSSLCANISMNLAMLHPEMRVVIADLVLPIGSIAGIVGYYGSQNLVTISHLPASETTPEFLRDKLPQMELWHFHLMAGSPDPEHGNELNVGRIGELVASLKSAFDIVVLDLGRSLSRISMPLIEQSDLIAMVTATDVSSVDLTKTVWDFLQTKGVQAGSAYVILNRAVGLEGLTKAEAENILGISIKTTLPYLGGSFSMANNQHQPYSLKFPGDTASIVLKDAASEMMGLIQRMRS